MNCKLDAGETKVMDGLTGAWNEWVKLEPLHPDGLDEFRHAIHAAQHILMSRPVQRHFNAVDMAASRPPARAADGGLGCEDCQKPIDRDEHDVPPHLCSQCEGKRKLNRTTIAQYEWALSTLESIRRSSSAFPEEETAWLEHMDSIWKRLAPADQAKLSPRHLVDTPVKIGSTMPPRVDLRMPVGPNELAKALQPVTPMRGPDAKARLDAQARIATFEGKHGIKISLTEAGHAVMVDEVKAVDCVLQIAHAVMQAYDAKRNPPAAEAQKAVDEAWPDVTAAVWDDARTKDVRCKDINAVLKAAKDAFDAALS